MANFAVGKGQGQRNPSSAKRYWAKRKEDFPHDSSVLLDHSLHSEDMKRRVKVILQPKSKHTEQAFSLTRPVFASASGRPRLRLARASSFTHHPIPNTYFALHPGR